MKNITDLSQIKVSSRIKVDEFPIEFLKANQLVADVSYVGIVREIKDNMIYLDVVSDNTPLNRKHALTAAPMTQVQDWESRLTFA